MLSQFTYTVRPGTSFGMPGKYFVYSSVREMIDDFRKGEFQQVAALCRFIRANPSLLAALKTHDWHKVATIYNGAAYKEMALKWGE